MYYYTKVKNVQGHRDELIRDKRKVKGGILFRKKKDLKNSRYLRKKIYTALLSEIQQLVKQIVKFHTKSFEMQNLEPSQIQHALVQKGGQQQMLWKKDGNDIISQQNRYFQRKTAKHTYKCLFQGL